MAGLCGWMSPCMMLVVISEDIMSSKRREAVGKDDKL